MQPRSSDVHHWQPMNTVALLLWERFPARRGDVMTRGTRFTARESSHSGDIPSSSPRESRLSADTPSSSARSTGLTATRSRAISGRAIFSSRHTRLSARERRSRALFPPMLRSRGLFLVELVGLTTLLSRFMALRMRSLTRPRPSSPRATRSSLRRRDHTGEQTSLLILRARSTGERTVLLDRRAGLTAPSASSVLRRTRCTRCLARFSASRAHSLAQHVCFVLRSP